jgi:N-acetylmuramoyl-L-alanine amidase
MLKGKLDDAGVDCYVVDHYEGGTYGAAMTFVSSDATSQKCTLAIELHFNAASSSAKGYEYLYWHTSTEGQKLANAFIAAQKALNTPSPSRGAKPADGGDRGSGFLSKTPCPAIICEPFFGSNSAEWGYWNGRPDVLANVYADAIKSYLK